MAKHKAMPDLSLCAVCQRGTCCREGVEADLFEVARILEKYSHLKIPKPWFQYLSRDSRFPSGYKFSTLLKNRRCIFQDERMRCMVYDQRPRYCAEFPIEDGKRAPFYSRLCHHAPRRKRRAPRRIR